jgi:hypothetical protein
MPAAPPPDDNTGATDCEPSPISRTPAMRRWTFRLLYAMLLGVSLPAGLSAQGPAVSPPVAVSAPVPPPGPQLDSPGYPPPYNGPGPGYAANTDAPQPGGGCSGCVAGKHGGLFGWLKGKGGSCSKGGSCTTCCNTDNFIFASSRSFFGESSREFFERPPSVDGIKHCPAKYAPPRGAGPSGGPAGGCAQP